jgi:ABC-type Zn uptake system ZnuABC Zn-binding protein ZnuA
MKKLIALLMVCGFALTFAACGGSSSQNEANSEDTTATAPTMEPAPQADTTAADTTGK